MKKEWQLSWPKIPESEGYVKVTHDNKKKCLFTGTICYVSPIGKVKTVPALHVFYIYPMMTHKGMLHIYGSPDTRGGTHDWSVFVDSEQTKESYDEFFKLCIRDMIDAGRLYINTRDQRVRFNYEKK